MAQKRELRTVLSLEGEQKYTQGIKNIKNSLSNVATQQSLLNAEYEKGDRSLAKLSKQQDILRQKLELQRQKVNMIREVYEKSAAKGEENAEITQKLASELNVAQAAMLKTERELSKLSEEMAEITPKTAAYRDKLKELGVTAESVGGALQKIGDRISGTATAIAASIATPSIKGWMELEDEMANVGTIADTTQKSMEELTAEVISASDATGTAARQIAQAQYQAISAGINTADSVNVVADAAKAAKAGVSDVNTVIDGATSIINGWKLETSQATTVFDRLLKTQQLGKTTIGELASSIGSVTGLAPQMNIELNDILAATAALTLAGDSTSEAMNGLRNVLSSVLKPTAEATKEAGRLGLQFDSAALKSKGLAGFLADVQEKTGGSEESLAKLFGSVEALSRVMALGGAAAESYTTILGELNNSAGTLDEMFGTRTSSSAERFSISLNKINNSAIKLGQSLAPYIDLAADEIEQFSDAVSGMSGSEAQNIIETALWIAGISKGISVLGRLSANITNITKGIKAASAVLGPAGPMVAGITAAGLAAAGAVKLIDGMSNSLSGELRLNVDTSELDDYKIDAHTLKDPVKIQAQAELEIITGLNTVKDELVNWLSDGVPETEEEKADMASKVNEAIDGAFRSIRDHFDAKKMELDQQLSAGIISEETYNQSVSELEDKAKELETSLTTQADAVNSYVASLVASNKKITEGEISHLTELLNVLGKTSTEVLEATNAAKAAYEAAYRKTSVGLGDKTDQRTAVEYIELQYRTDTESIEATQKAVKAKYAGQIAGATETQISELAAQEAEELRALQNQLEELEEKRNARYGELIQGIARKEGFDIAELSEYLKLDAGINSGMKASELGYERLEEALAKYDELEKKYAEIDMSAFEEVVKSLLANDDAEEDGIVDGLAAMADAMNALNKAATENNGIANLPTEYSDAGFDAVEGLVRELNKGEIRAYAAGYGLGAAAERGTKAALKIKSPSKVFAQIGRFTMEGLINGVNEKLDAVKNTYSAATKPSAQTTQFRQTMENRPGSTINNYINYTAGAGTRREARMLNQRLAQEQKLALVAEGL